MRFEFESYDEKCKMLDQWANWFAWYPVFLSDQDKPTLVWFETIQRRKRSPMSNWNYRSIPDFDLFI
jgi:hypothetical protein